MSLSKKYAGIASTQYISDTVFTLEVKNIKYWQDYQNFWLSQGQTIRLRQALEAHHANLAGDVYTDIIIHVPQHIYNKIRGKIEDFLLKEHAKDFKGRLYKNRLPSYLLLPQEDMDEDSIIFYFGPYVFAPNSNDKPLFSLNIFINNHNIPSCCSSQHCTDFLTIYEGQEGVRFGTDSSCPFKVNAQLWGKREYNFYDITTNQVEEGNIIVATSGVGAERINVILEQKIHINCKSTEQDPHATPITLLLSSFEKNKNVQCESNKKTYDLISKKELDKVVGKIFIDGFLLPKLNISEQSLHGSSIATINSWYIWLDSHYRLLEPRSHDDESIFCILKHNKNTDGIFFKKNMQQWMPITSLAPHILSNIFMTNLPAELQERFLAILRNKKRIECPLFSQCPVIIGRICTGFQAETETFHLNQLKDTTKFEYRDGTTTTDLGRIGTSGTHLEATMLDNGMLHLKQLSKNSPIYLLDSDNKISNILDVISSTGKKDADIPKGTRFIVGTYLLRFDNV